MAKPKKKATKRKPTAKKRAAEPTGIAKKAAEAATAGVALSVKGQKKTNATLAVLPIGSIEIMEGFNPRASMGSREDMDLLTTNMEKEGLIHPLVVRPTKKAGQFELVCGHRRLAAMKRLKWPDVACTIRADLQGDDAKAKAMAVAENSEDIDKPLNHIEIGMAARELQKKHDWSPQKIADYTGVNVAKIRRALTLVNAPADVQKKVIAGDISMIAAVEISKMDATTRARITPQIKRNMSAAQIKRLAKKDAQKSATPKAGRAANKQKGRSRDASIVTWQGARAKQERIVEFAATLADATGKEKTTQDYFEVRGGLSALLWDRGDLDSPVLPSEKKSEQNPGDPKTLRKFQALVKAEAKKWTPKEDEEEEE